MELDPNRYLPVWTAMSRAADALEEAGEAAFQADPDNPLYSLLLSLGDALSSFEGGVQEPAGIDTQG